MLCEKRPDNTAVIYMSNIAIQIYKYFIGSTGMEQFPQKFHHIYDDMVYIFSLDSRPRCFPLWNGRSLYEKTQQEYTQE